MESLENVQETRAENGYVNEAAALYPSYYIFYDKSVKRVQI